MWVPSLYYLMGYSFNSFCFTPRTIVSVCIHNYASNPFVFIPILFDATLIGIPYVNCSHHLLSRHLLSRISTLSSRTISALCSSKSPLWEHLRRLRHLRVASRRRPMAWSFSRINRGTCTSNEQSTSQGQRKHPFTWRARYEGLARSCVLCTWRSAPERGKWAGSGSGIMIQRVAGPGTDRGSGCGMTPQSATQDKRSALDLPPHSSMRASSLSPEPERRIGLRYSDLLDGQHRNSIGSLNSKRTWSRVPSPHSERR